jgi:hypothetical protein
MRFRDGGLPSIEIIRNRRTIEFALEEYGNICFIIVNWNAGR